jgi:hypothetical protein
LGELSFNTLESISLWGIPITIDEKKLSLGQAKVLVGMVEKFMDEAKHSKEIATKLAVDVFKQMYEVDGEEWKALKLIRLNKHLGVVVKNKFFDQDRLEKIMARAKSNILQDSKKEESKHVWVNLLEQGARHGKADKKRIYDSIHNLIASLNVEDQKDIFSEISSKYNLKFRFRKNDFNVNPEKSEEVNTKGDDHAKLA